MVEFFFICQIVKFYKIFHYSKLVYYYIALFVNYLENWLIFQFRNFWNFFNWTFLGGIQNIERSNVVRPGFRNCKITNIEIKKNELFFLFTNFFFIF